MKFYTTQHPYYCGIDLHARSLYVCILDANGANGYQASYVDHFNNKDKARNLWVSVSVSF